jgi:[FeFe] hydrogenase H-cluster maturation GTPase HydF
MGKTGSTPKGLRLHIGFFGRRNVGKSSLLNAVTRQSVSIVSEEAGTTTDPVEKPMELLPLGPVLFIDTAGIDDAGIVGDLRVRKTKQAFDRTDLGILVTDGEWGPYEKAIQQEFVLRETPFLVVFNKSDLSPPPGRVVGDLRILGVTVVRTVASKGDGILDLREAMIQAAPPEYLDSPLILRDLVPAGKGAVLVIPIDKEAPKGRIINPQVQAIRDLLDGDAYCVVTKEDLLPQVLGKLTEKPALVVTDSQAFGTVSTAVPKEIPLTSFSILFSRVKGDLVSQTEGALAIDRLKPGDRVLIGEACTHHPVEDDIGRVKLPRWLDRHVGGGLSYTVVQGLDFPEDLTPFSLVIHCGACMWNRKTMLGRIFQARRQNVPITNYGMAIAKINGILRRALEPFPEVRSILQAADG